MTMFYQGALQDGIALAMRDAKAVVCFVRDDNQLSSTWEEEYFQDEEVKQVLDSKSVALRLMAGTQEAGFLTSFCPIATFPAVVVIKNGTLKDYLQATTPKDQFKQRLIEAVEGQGTSASGPSQEPQTTGTNDPTISSSSVASHVTPNTASQQQPQSTHASVTSRPVEQKPQESSKPKEAAKKGSIRKAETPKGETSKAEPKSQSASITAPRTKKALASQTPAAAASKNATASTAEDPKPQSSAPRGPPTQYRLQVRLFDGRSIRSSFLPTQTIRGDVRPWLDQQMVDDHRPYNLKHILTPLPSRTLSLTEESQTLQDIGLGSTANLVMVPVQSYTEAYTAGGSLPVRAISGMYNAVSSIAGTATGLVGSFLGYGTSASTNGSASSPTSSTENTQRARSSGPNIRTLRDRENERGKSQLYNGNQLNFEPRNQDGKDN